MILKKIEAKLLSELLKDSKRSDRELARVLKVSQPTITRNRHKLEKKGWVQQYTVIPDFAKMGFEICAISCFKSPLNKEFTEQARIATMSKPNVVCAVGCSGMGMDAVVISLHKNYSDYADFIRKLRTESAADMKTESIIVSLEGQVFKPFGLRYLAETLEK